MLRAGCFGILRAGCLTWLLALVTVVCSAAGPSCVVLKGVPKSGTTWLTSLLDGAIATHCATIDAAAAAADPRCSSCPSVRPGPGIKHKHVLPPGAVYVIVYRDARDIVVSKYHWTTGLSGNHNLTDVNTFVVSKQGIKAVVADQNDMLQAERDASNQGVRVFRTYYEDLKRTPQQTLRELCARLGLLLSDRQVSQCLNASSFENMRATEERGEMDLVIHPDSAQRLQQHDEDPANLNGVMTRRGEIGSWGLELNDETRAYAERAMRHGLSKELLAKFLDEDECAFARETAQQRSPATSSHKAVPMTRNLSPNIVVLVADDMGFNETEQMPFVADVSRRPGTIKLMRHYALWSCSPTRSSFLTGRHSARWGAGGSSYHPWMKEGVPLSEVLLPEVLSKLGYVTKHAGKWHLGHGYREYLPTGRGFKWSYGHLNGAIHYYSKVPGGTYVQQESPPDWQRDGSDVSSESSVRYSTHMISNDAIDFIVAQRTAPFFLYVAYNAVHGPLSADSHPAARGYSRFRPDQGAGHACNVKARAFLEMDAGILQIWNALHSSSANGGMNNTLILFTSDNGATKACPGANHPLRGTKKTMWEGGLRVPAWVYFPRHVRSNKRLFCPVHVTDWFPTFVNLAGGQTDPLIEYDGQNLMPLLEGALCRHTTHTFGNREIVLQLLAGQSVVGALLRVHTHDQTHCWKPQHSGAPISCAALSLFKVVKTETDVQIFELVSDPREETNLYSGSRGHPERIPWYGNLTQRDRALTRAILQPYSEMSMVSGLEAKHARMHRPKLNMTDRPPAGWQPPTSSWVPTQFKCESAGFPT